MERCPPKILLVDDEPLAAMLTEDMLAHLGFACARLATRLDDAKRAALRERFDFAVLDVNLGGGQFVFPVADILAARQIPFLFATGHGRADIPSQYRNRPLLEKPFSAEELAAAVGKIAPRKCGSAPAGRS